MPRPLRFGLIGFLVLTLLLAGAPAAQADTQFHVVQPGETLASIAQLYGVTVEAIQAANGMTGTDIYAGQTLVIPDSNAPVTTQATGTVYIVQRGETLFTIGLKFNLSWTAIQAANSLTGTKIYAGQRLIIPTAAAAVSTSAEAPTPAPTADASQPPAADAPPDPNATGEIIHVVQRGDTLFTIGLKYNLPWTTIQAANGLPGTKIYTGQRLVIPTGTSGAGGATVPVVEAPPPPAGDGKRFLVDLSEQRLYAYEGDTLVRTTLISSGLPRWPTVTGTFYIYLRYTSARMRGPDYDLPNVPYVMYFYKSYGLHGTYWHNNFGTPMSHGCVNMPTPEAEWAYNWSTYGTPVIIQP